MFEVNDWSCGWSLKLRVEVGIGNFEGLKVGKGSRDFASTTARKVVQIASIMHH